MKRICLLIAIILILSGCTPKAVFNKPVTFYYPAADTAQEAFCAVSVEGIGMSADQLIETYLSGTHAGSDAQPMPDFFSSVCITSKEHSILSVVLPDHVSEYPANKLVVLCACITATFCPIADADVVEFRCENVPILGKDTLVMSPDSIVFTDMYMQNLEK